MVAGRELGVRAGGDGGEDSGSMLMAGLDADAGPDVDGWPGPQSTAGNVPRSGPGEHPFWTFGGGGTFRHAGELSSIGSGSGPGRYGQDARPGRGPGLGVSGTRSESVARSGPGYQEDDGEDKAGSGVTAGCPEKSRLVCGLP